MDLVRLFQEAGTPAYGLLLLGMLGALAALGGTLTAWMTRPAIAAGAAGVQAALGIGTWLVGAAAYAFGISRMNAALAVVDPEMVDTIRAAGTGEAMAAGLLAASAAALPLAGALAAGARVLRPPGPLAIVGALTLGSAVLAAHAGAAAWIDGTRTGFLVLAMAAPEQREALGAAAAAQATTAAAIGAGVAFVLALGGAGLLLVAPGSPPKP